MDSTEYVSKNIEPKKQEIVSDIDFPNRQPKKFIQAFSNLRRDYKNFRNKSLNIYRTGDFRHADDITNWVSQITLNNINTIDDIKAFLDRQRRDERWSFKQDTDIIQAVLTMKQSAERVYFNSSVFKTPLHYYVYGGKLKVSCLTNDYLTLALNCDLILQQTDIGFDLMGNCQIESVTTSSDIFQITEPPISGYIQDYKPEFSAICEQDTDTSEIINIFTSNRKPGNVFDYDGKTYGYSPAPKVTIIYLNSLQNNEVIEYIRQMKYLGSENNSITAGEKRLPFTENSYYIYKKLIPEKFCPAYWTIQKDLEVNFLFDYIVDYNYLYKVIEDNSQSNIYIPDNICYWGTLTPFFNFISVLALTSQKLSIEQRKTLAKMADKYFDLRPIITKIQENQLLLSRCFVDFFNCFLLNRELSAFLYLSNRLEKYLERSKILEKNPAFADAKSFFDSCDFCSFISRQFRANISEIPKKMSKVLSDYISGKNLTSLSSNIKDVAKQIYPLFPDSTLDEAAFPILLPKGGIAIGDVNQYLVDTKIEIRKEEISKGKKKERKKEKDESEDVVEKFNAIDSLVDEYLKLHDSGIMPELRGKVKQKVREKATQDSKFLAQVTKASKHFIINKNTLTKKDNMPALNKIIKESKAEITNIKKAAVKKKRAQKPKVTTTTTTIKKETDENINAQEEEEEKSESSKLSKKRKRDDSLSLDLDIE